MVRGILLTVVFFFACTVPVRAQDWMFPAAFVVKALFSEPPVSAEGSPQARYWVNVRAGRDGVERVTNATRERLIKSHDLVSLATVPYLEVHAKLERNKRYLRDYAAESLSEIAAFYAEDTGLSLPLNSALRTIEQQRSILPRRVKVGKRWVWVGNMNAIPPDGPLGSAHPFGNTVDLARFRIPDWYEPIFEGKLLSLEAHHCLDVTKESGQAVYHVTFFKQCQTGTIATVLEGTK